MTKVNAVEMRTVEGGASAKCACGRTFKDQKFLWWVVNSAKSQLKSHKKFCWTRGYTDKQLKDMGIIG